MDGKVVETLEAELQQVKEENNTLRLMLEVQRNKYKKLLQSYVQEVNNNKADEENKSFSLFNNFDDTNKRARVEFITNAKKPIQVFVKTHPKDDSLIIKDGHQWRKYGQKVTKENASPRAYYRCSMAPRCPAKRKVQRWLHDRSILVATYEGEHNHGASHESFPPSSSTLPIGSRANNLLPLTTIPNDKDALINIDHATRFCENVKKQRGHGSNIKIEEYVSSLINDPDFTVALAEAVVRSVIDQPKQQSLNLNLGLPEE